MTNIHYLSLEGMPTYQAERRSNELDEPKPAKAEHEWIISTNPYTTWFGSWPDTDEGKAAARLIADKLNQVQAEAFGVGKQMVQDGIKELLEIES